MPPDRTARRFTLLDLMIFTAALAAGLAHIRMTWMRIPGGGEPTGLLRFVNLNYKCVQAAWSLAAPFGLALLLCPWSSPRGRGRRAWQRPGTVAAAATTAAVLFHLIYVLPVLAAIGYEAALRRGFLSSDLFVADHGQEVTFAVVGAWTTLVIGGRYRPERSGPDRLGRFLGWLWVVGYLIMKAGLILIVT